MTFQVKKELNKYREQKHLKQVQKEYVVAVETVAALAVTGMISVSHKSTSALSGRSCYQSKKLRRSLELKNVKVV